MTKKRVKRAKRLSLDQFAFNDKGELVIKSAEIKELSKAPVVEATPAEAGAIIIGTGIQPVEPT